MAWTETCKIDANKQIEHLAQKGMSKTDAIKKLSAESDIPFGTIQRWVYPRNEGKNDPTPTTPQDDSEKVAGQGNGNAGQTAIEWPYCSECHRPVEKNYRNYKPHSSGMCRTCRRNYPKKMAEKKAKEEFEKIPIDQEADLFWKEFAKKLNKIADNIGEENFKKISWETVLLLCEPISRFNRICEKVSFKSQFVQK